MINQTDVFTKTEKGSEEIKSRKYKLSPKLRTMLILIDGTKPAAALTEQAAKLGVEENFLETLHSQGFITKPIDAEPTPAPASGALGVAPAESASPAVPATDDFERYTRARKFMTDTAAEALGIKAFFFTLKIEKCANLNDLKALVPDYSKALAKNRGVEEAQVFLNKLRELLG